MKPLTIEQLKSLEVGDWVWIVTKGNKGFYGQIDEDTDDNALCIHSDFMPFVYRNYGTKWVAYKNKEMAEAKGEIVELPCRMHDKAWFVVNRGKFSRIVETYVTKIQVVYGRIEICFNETVRVLRFHSNGKRENLYDIYLDKAEAERRLAEMTKE